MKKNYEPMVFTDSELVEIPVTIGAREFILREADGATAKMYRDRMLKAVKFAGQGNVTGVQGLAELEPFLVSQCLFYAKKVDGVVEIDKDEKTRKPKRVAQSWIETLPSRIQKSLYNRIRQISELEEGEGPERRLLEEVLSADDLPNIEGYAGLVDHVKDLAEEDGKFDPLLKWLSPGDEAKNERSASAIG